MYFVDEVFEKDFYKEQGAKDPPQFSFGQIFTTPAYYPHEQMQIWRPAPDPTEPTKTYAEEFVIMPKVGNAFKRDLPLGAPPLKANEEFLVIRAKIRPVVVIRPELPPLDISKGSYKGAMQRRRCLVAQVYGTRYTATNELKYPPLFVERVRRMLYPHLMFLTEKRGPFEVASILRLDELQTVFTPHLTPTGYALSDYMAGVLQDQIR